MATSTQYSPNNDLNDILRDQKLSKTVYALTSSLAEDVKKKVFSSPDYYDWFREAWTGKQDQLHKEFADKWVEWSLPVVDFNRDNYPFFYPTAGASEGIRQIIFEFGVAGGKNIHIFEGEYEGYKAMAQAANLNLVEHKRDALPELEEGVDLFFLSQPSAIDGNVWSGYNNFISSMARNTVFVDVTYVGVANILGPINLDAPSIKYVAFSLSKPFGVYYDRIGGLWAREESLGLFGNMWFKNISSLLIGCALLEYSDVYLMYDRLHPYQKKVCKEHGLAPSDVAILGSRPIGPNPSEMDKYLQRGDGVRICLTPAMVHLINEDK